MARFTCSGPTQDIPSLVWHHPPNPILSPGAEIDTVMLGFTPTWMMECAAKSCTTNASLCPSDPDSSKMEDDRVHDQLEQMSLLRDLYNEVLFSNCSRSNKEM